METNESNDKNLAGGLTLVAGLWLIIAPYVFSNLISGSGKWAQVATGGILLIVGLAELAARNVWASWVSGLVGVWLIISPFSFNVSTTSKWDEVVVGAIVMALAVFAGQSVTKLREATR